MLKWVGELFSSAKFTISRAFKSAKSFAFVLFGLLFMQGSPLFAAAIAAPDMTDAITSVTAVFGAVLGVSVLIFGFKRIKSLL